MQQQRRPLIYSDSELELANKTFSKNNALIMLIRKFFLQGEMEKKEMETLRKIIAGDVLALLKKRLAPEINVNAPIGELIDLWSSVPTMNVGIEECNLAMEARMILVDYIRQMFEILECKKSLEEMSIKLSDLVYSPYKEKRQALVEMSARNTIVDHIEWQLGLLKTLAGTKKETAEEIKKRLEQDSAK